MRTMYDDAYPPSNPPKTDAVAFYIGGDTPHVWSDAEVERQSARYRLPIWVRSNPNGSSQGHNEGVKAVNWAHSHSQQKGTCIALDFEMAVDADYVTAFDGVVFDAGYKTLLYGSEAYVLNNPRPSGGYWVAKWDNSTSLPANWAAKQYASDQMLGKSWDLSVVADHTPLWDTQQKVDDMSFDLTSPVPVNDGKGGAPYWAAGVMGHTDAPPSVAYCLLNAGAGIFYMNNTMLPMMKAMQDTTTAALKAVQALSNDPNVDVTPILNAIEQKINGIHLSVTATESEPQPADPMA